MSPLARSPIGAAVGLTPASPANAQEAQSDAAAELARKLANPVAALISGWA